MCGALTPPETPPASASFDADALAAASSSTTATELARIAGTRADLHATLALNPASYPALLSWLARSPDPAVHAALARRAALHENPAVPSLTVSVPGVPAQPSSPRRRRLAVVVSILVAALVLAGGGVLAWRLLTNPNPADAVGSVAPPSGQWVNGAEKTWTLSVGKDARIIGDGTQIVVLQSSSDGSIDRLSAYDVSGDQPREQWQARVDAGSLQASAVSYWDRWVVAGGEAFSASDGARKDLPWHVEDYPLLVGSTAIVCDSSDTCTAWTSSSLDKPLWTVTVPRSHDYMDSDATRNAMVPNDANQVLLAPDTVVNVSTGQTLSIKDPGDSSLIALSDGWMSFHPGSTAMQQEVTIYDTDGKEVDSFTGSHDNDSEIPLPTRDHALVSSAEMRAWMVDHDVSWAPVRSRQSLDDSPECPLELIVDDSTVTPTTNDGSCVFNGAAYAAVSDDRSVVVEMWSSPRQTGSGYDIAGMWSVRDGQRVRIGSRNSHLYLVNPSLVVASDESGSLTGYVPSKG